MVNNIEQHRSTSGDLEAGGVITVPWADGMRAGYGYDPAARVSKGVSPAKKTSKFEGEENVGVNIDFSIRRVESVDEIQDYLQVEGGISGAYKLFSGSISSDFARNVKINSYSIYFLIKSVVVSNAEYATPVKLSKDAQNLTALHFKKKFGTHFVSARKKGSSFFALLEVRTDSEETRLAVVSELKANIGDKKLKGNIKANFENAIKKASSHEGVSLSLQVIAHGVGPDILEKTQGFTPLDNNDSDESDDD